MSDATNFRMERISKLLRELEYEVTRGMMEGDIDETIGFTFVVPLSKAIREGVVNCEFRTRPVHRVEARFSEPRLRLVSGGKDNTHG